jgi:hypothetical protein
MRSIHVNKKPMLTISLKRYINLDKPREGFAALRMVENYAAKAI